SLVVLRILMILYSLQVKRKSKQMALLVQENNFSVGESNHRIKNNLQLIISLIGSEIYKSNHATQESVHISEKINAIAALHQQLYLSVDKRKVSLKKYFSSIEQSFKIGLIQDSVDFSIETEDFDIPTDKAVYIG